MDVSPYILSALLLNSKGNNYLPQNLWDSLIKFWIANVVPHVRDQGYQNSDQKMLLFVALDSVFQKACLTKILKNAFSSRYTTNLKCVIFGYFNIQPTVKIVNVHSRKNFNNLNGTVVCTRDTYKLKTISSLIVEQTKLLLRTVILWYAQCLTYGLPRSN